MLFMTLILMQLLLIVCHPNIYVYTLSYVWVHIMYKFQSSMSFIVDDEELDHMIHVQTNLGRDVSKDPLHRLCWVLGNTYITNIHDCLFRTHAIIIFRYSWNSNTCFGTKYKHITYCVMCVGVSYVICRAVCSESYIVRWWVNTTIYYIKVASETLR